MGVAMILTIISDKRIKHGPLEVVITSDEEVGQTGIDNLDKTKLRGKHLISLDGYDEKEIFAGSASVIAQFYDIPITTSIEILKDVTMNDGGDKQGALSRLIKIGKKTISEVINIKKEVTSSNDVALSLSISGLAGGHVALGMSHPRRIQNAIKEIFYILYLLSEKIEFNIAEINGGESNHSIPIDCKVTILLKPNDTKIVHRIFNEHMDFLSKKYIDEKNIKYRVSTANCEKPYISVSDTMKVVDFINSIYNGIVGYDSDFNKYNACSYIGAIKYVPGEKIVKVYGGTRGICKLETKKESSRMTSLCKLLKINYFTSQLAIG
jgi:dipeptidase D